MKGFAPLIGATLCVLALDASKVSAQTTPSVLGSGAVAASNGHARIAATVGQSAIGIVAAPSTEVSQGFWHARTSAGTSLAPANRNASAPLTISGAPNPFNRSTTLSFAVPHAGRATVILFDALGRRVMTVLDEELQAGPARREIDLSELSSGSYTAVLRLGDRSGTTPLLLVD